MGRFEEFYEPPPPEIAWYVVKGRGSGQQIIDIYGPYTLDAANALAVQILGGTYDLATIEANYPHATWMWVYH